MPDVLVRIARMLFEPFAVIALLGSILALWQYRHRRGELFWLFSSAILFMLSWRVAIKIVSSRYAHILIYPALFLCVWCCLQLGRYCPGRWRQRVSLGLFGILIVIAFAKDLRFNRYNNAIPYVCKMIRTDAAGQTNPLLTAAEDEVARYQYYSGLQVIAGRALNTGPDVIRDLKKTLLPYRGYNGTVYLLIYERNPGILSGETLGLAQGEWTFIASRYRNERRKLALSAYRYTPFPRHEELSDGQKKASGKNLLANGNFTQMISGEKIYQRQQLSAKGFTFFDNPQLKWPAGWGTLEMNNYHPDSAPEIEIVRNTVDGESFLRIAGKREVFFCCWTMYPTGHYRLSFLAKGKPGNLLGVSLFLLDAEKQPMTWQPILYRKAESNLTEYQVEFNAEDLSPGVFFYLCLVVEAGDVVFSNLILEAVK